MHLPKSALLVGLFVAVAHAETDYTCGSLSTVFVTIPASPVTKTVSIPVETPTATAGNDVLPTKPAVPSDFVTSITTTLTEYVTFLDIVSTVPANPTSGVASQDHYTFTENHGTTFWFGGKTPPAGVPLVTSTATVTIQPVPLSSGVSTGGSAEPTTYLTVFLNVVKKKHETVVLTKTAPVAIASSIAAVSSVPSAPSPISTPLAVSAPPIATASLFAKTLTKNFGEHRLNGWNTTLTAVPKEKAAESGTEPLKPLHKLPNVKENHAASLGTASLAAVTKHIEARQLGAIVVATIEGVVVSWTNDYDGSAAATPAPVPTKTHAALKEDLLVTIETHAASQEDLLVTIETHAASQEDPVATAPVRIEVPIYPWDLQPIPVEVSPVISPEPTLVSSFEQPPTKLPHHRSSTPTNFQETLVLTLSSVQQIERVKLSTSSPTSSSPTSSSPTSSSPTGSFIQTGIRSQQLSVSSRYQKTRVFNLSSVPSPVPTTIVTSVIRAHSSHKTSSTKTSSLGDFDRSSTAQPAASATPSSCTGTKAEFVIDFDDLPHFSTGPDDVDIPPIFNPYRKLFFEDHYGYVPPPSDPFPPISPPQLAVYRANQGVNVDGSPDAGLESAGEFGAGPRATESAYWIDAFSVYFGCENGGPSDCIITINGYQNGSSTRVVSQTVTQPPCPGLQNCQLSLLEFNDNFRNLSGIQFLAAVDRKLTVYYMDDLSLGWSNNTCAAQWERANAR